MRKWSGVHASLMEAVLFTLVSISKTSQCLGVVDNGISRIQHLHIGRKANLPFIPISMLLRSFPSFDVKADLP
jgi:hypothetical protein